MSHYIVNHVGKFINYPLKSTDHCCDDVCIKTYNLVNEDDILDYLKKIFFSTDIKRPGFLLHSAISVNKNIGNYVDKRLKKYFNDDIIKKMSANQKIYHVLNDVDNIPICKECGKKYVKFDESIRSYHATCGSICNNLYIENINKRLVNNFNHTNVGNHEIHIIDTMFQNHTFKRGEKIGAFFPDFVDYENKIIYEVNEIYHFRKRKIRTDKRKYGYLKSLGWKINIVFDFCERKLTNHFFNKILNWKNEFIELVNDVFIFLENDNPKILTPNGWSLFDGIIKYKNAKTINVQINNKNIIATPEHKFLINDKFIEANKLKHFENKNEDVFDVLNVQKNNIFFINENIISHNCLVCDEFAFLAPGLEDEFLQSVFPVVSSSKTSKIIIVSTPNGMGNEFYRIWNRAELNLDVKEDDGKPKWKPVRVNWWEVPGRDEKWKEMQLESFGRIGRKI